MKKVIVLMSTYNGEKYIKEQIDSILNQKYVDLKLFVRDDGSNDSTVQILDEYQKLGQLKWYSGENLKPAKSFLNLLKNCDKADYYAFADQDDYWHEDKLYNALEKLEKEDYKFGKLYISALNVVDSNLNYIYNQKIPMNIDFKAEMIKNYATGCTMVFDNRLRDIVNKNEISYIEMHDSLICRIASLYDCPIICDNASFIDYRQHGNNVLGMTNNPIKTWKRRWNRFRYSNCESSKLAIEFLNIKDLNITKEKKQFLKLLSTYKKNIKNKTKLFRTKVFSNEDKITIFLFKLKVLFNKV